MNFTIPESAKLHDDCVDASSPRAESSKQFCDAEIMLTSSSLKRMDKELKKLIYEVIKDIDNMRSSDSVLNARKYAFPWRFVTTA